VGTKGLGHEKSGYPTDRHTDTLIATLRIVTPGEVEIKRRDLTSAMNAGEDADHHEQRCDDVERR